MTFKYSARIYGLVLLALGSMPSYAQLGIISTVAGGGSSLRSGVSATHESVCRPGTAAIDSEGNVYFGAYCQHAVFRVDHGSGLISILAANLNLPQGVALDHTGNLFIADSDVIRRLDATTHEVSVVVGGLWGAYNVTVDGSGNLFISEAFNNWIRRLDAVTGALTRVAGTGTQGYAGDDGQAINAELNFPRQVAIDTSGNLFITDELNQRIRRVDAATGIITTVAGGGTGCTVQSDGLGDGCPATESILRNPTGVALDSAGNLLISDSGSNRIRFVSNTSHIISTVAGTGAAGFSGNGGPATSARLFDPEGIAIDGVGNWFIGDAGNNRLRRVDAATRVIANFAGNGGLNYTGDNIPAVGAGLSRPSGLATDAAGNLFIFDSGNNRIRRVDAATGVITTVAGNGTAGYSGDGGLATRAQLNVGNTSNNPPNGIAVDRLGNLFIADSGNNRVRRGDAGTGVISTVAGTGVAGFSGDGGLARRARLNNPTGVAIDTAGNLLIVDSFNGRIRRVNAATRVISTIAGGGEGCAGQSAGGDGCPATSAVLAEPFGVDVDPAGNMFITQQVRVRRVDAKTGIISTVAGNGVYGYRDGLATKAWLSYPYGVVTDAVDDLFLADSGNNRLRRVDGLGHFITTEAGGGSGCATETDNLGDGCQARSASLSYVTAVARDHKGDVFIADFLNDRVRRVPLPKIWTQTMLTSIPNPSLVGQEVALTAKVTWKGGRPEDGEIVIFRDFSTIYGTAALNEGTAALMTSSIRRGIRNIRAIYGGDATFYGSEADITQSVTGYATTCSITSNRNPAMYGQEVTWTAAVTSSGPTALTGHVAFQWTQNGVTHEIGRAALNASGVASLSRFLVSGAGFSVGTFPIVAVYLGDPAHEPGSSPPLDQVILPSQ
jgi:trimeric autotransporter adhesin